MHRIGFIGLGAMGMPMARNLLARGHALAGFDLRQAALAELRGAGGEPTDNAAAAAAGADLLMLMVVDIGQARAVLFDGGALEALPDGAVVVLTATCPPDAVAALAAEVEAHGRRFADAPVSGGTAGAKAGSLSIMVGARPEVFAAVEPVLRGIGAKLFHVGDAPGAGAGMKAINQLLCGVHIAAAAEALALAERLGVEKAVALEIVQGSAAGSWMLNDRGPRMLEAEPEVTSAVDIFVKDLGIVLEAGRGAKAATPIAAVAHQLFLATSGRGDGRADDSQVIRTYRMLNGG
ncbi:MAG: NAD(P)-dependent oxidoreductase [Gluconacetobacter diazotrophicus]|nr:NAD(P)-dependent oxidoreductase [Gluconacetobacter diazotrophicus]